jgi:hypothetical protein
MKNNCEHLYKDASDKRYCVDCGKRIKYTKGKKIALLNKKIKEIEARNLPSDEELENLKEKLEAIDK